MTEDFLKYCAEITHWHPANTRWNRLKAFLRLGPKPELRRLTLKEITAPQMIWETLPKVPYEDWKGKRQ